MAARGRLFVISGPSGVGKGTVVRRLIDLRPDLAFSVSYTTRRRRPTEREGRHYRFVDREAFDRLIEDGQFLEWAEVFGERYGTPSAEVEVARRAGRDVLLEVNMEGARSVRARVPDAVLVFLAPPSEEELARRLSARGTESSQELQRRLREARREMAEAPAFDHVVLNDEVERAAAAILAIIDATPPAAEGDV